MQIKDDMDYYFHHNKIANKVKCGLWSLDIIWKTKKLFLFHPSRVDNHKML